MKFSINMFWWTFGLVLGSVMTYFFAFELADLDSAVNNGFAIGYVIGGAISYAFMFYGVSKACGSIRNRYRMWRKRRQEKRLVKLAVAEVIA
jgi:hypothetical protein